MALTPFVLYFDWLTKVKDGDQATVSKRVRYNTLLAGVPTEWESAANKESIASSQAQLAADIADDDDDDDDDLDRRAGGLVRSRSERGVSSTGRKKANSAAAAAAAAVSPDTPVIHYRGIRSLKHKHDKHYLEGLKKSSSIHDIPGDGDVTHHADVVTAAGVGASGGRRKSLERGQAT